MSTTTDRFVVVHVDHNSLGVYQVKDTATGRVRATCGFEKCAISKAFQLNRDEVRP